LAQGWHVRREAPDGPARRASARAAGRDQARDPRQVLRRGLERDQLLIGVVGHQQDDVLQPQLAEERMPDALDARADRPDVVARPPGPAAKAEKSGADAGRRGPASGPPFSRSLPEFALRRRASLSGAPSPRSGTAIAGPGLYWESGCPAAWSSTSW
jgi:hypothetical protein